MLRLAKYLRPYVVLILIAVALLFVQANADLALPDYMSNIVNYGIQQGGVQNAVPVAIRQSEMDRLTLFMSQPDKTTVLNSYALVDGNSPDYRQYVQDFPALASVPVYVLKPADQATIAKLNPIMGEAILAASSIQQALTDPAKAAAMSQGLGIDLSKVPAGTDVFTLMAQLPPAAAARIVDAMNQKFATLGERMIVQTAVGPIRAEYAAPLRHSGENAR